MPSLSFVATGNAVVHAGFKPVFVDIRKKTLRFQLMYQTHLWVVIAGLVSQALMGMGEESFNSILRMTCLDRCLFMSMAEARVVKSVVKGVNASQQIVEYAGRWNGRSQGCSCGGQPVGLSLAVADARSIYPFYVLRLA